MNIVGNDAYTFIDNALAQGKSGLISANYWQKLFRPNSDSLQSEYDDLQLKLQSQGWSDETIRLFANFADDAKSAAGDSWGTDMDSTRMSVTANLGSLPFADPSGTAVLGPSSQLQSIWNQIVAGLNSIKRWAAGIIVIVVIIYLLPEILGAFVRYRRARG
jgi:hypothetical protein